MSMPRAVIRGMFSPVRLDDPTSTSLVGGGALAVTGLLAQGLLRFATSFLVGRLAGAEQLGVVASAIAVATILALLWPTSTGSAASKFLARARGAGSPQEARSTARHLKQRAIATTLVLAGASVPAWVFVDQGTWVGALAVAALTVGYGGYTFTRGVQFGTGQTLRATCWDVSCVVVGLAGLSVLLLLGVRGLALVLPLAAAYGLYAVAGWPIGRATGPDRRRRREMDGFVALAAVGSLASTGFLQLSQIVAKMAGGDAGAGRYAAALALATPASMLAASLTLVLLPALSETFGRSDPAAFDARTDQANRSMTIVVVAVFASIGICSRLLIELIWGAAFSDAATVLVVLVAAVLCTNLAVVSVNALTARSQRGMAINVGASVGGMLVGVAVWLVAIPALGERGVALGYLCGAMVIAIVPVVAVWRSGGHRWGALYRKVLIALGLIAVLAWGQRSLDLPLALDPVFAVTAVLLWWSVNRSDAARLPRPWQVRRS